jgi:hypothetical protein
MLEKRKNVGTILMAFGGFILLLEIIGILTNTLGEPLFLYFIGGLLEGLGMVFILDGFVFRAVGSQNMEMI